MGHFKKKRKGYLLILPLLLLSLFFLAILQDTEIACGVDSKIDLGKKVYESRCLLCHGSKGDGQGAIGIIDVDKMTDRAWTIYPRDLTVGVYKFRSTPTGCLPDDKDLVDTITSGITKSGMPSHYDLPAKEKKALVGYVKSFSERFGEEEACETITVKKPEWVGNLDSVEKGRKIYDKVKCWECHGALGKGDGSKSNILKDDWGKPIWPFDFSSAELKRGTSPENVYVTFTSGLDGTGMPSYEDSLNEEDRWHLVSYTLRLMQLVK